ncbi:MAG: phospholipase D-like domain-containing protein [Tibeticola sp.]
MLDYVLDHAFSLHSVLALVGLAVYVTGSRTLHQRRHPSAAVAWVLTLLLMPYVALPLYLLFGNRKMVRRRERLARASAAPAPTTEGFDLPRLAQALALPPAAAYEDLAVHADGAAAQEALRSGIATARAHIEISTFVLGRDAFGEALIGWLAERAAAGVRVRLLVDGVGAWLGGHPDLDRVQALGIEVRRFVPPFRWGLRGRTNLRNHRKKVIVDGRWLWSGGRNLAAEYFSGYGPHAPWVDLSFELRGEAAQAALALFERDWVFAQDGDARSRPPLPKPATVPAPPAAATRRVQLIPSGPDQADDTVFAVLVSAFFTARRRIVAVTPYFVPDETLLLSLTLAARRGVQVELLLPARSNHRLADLARHRALRELAAAGARVRLMSGMVHAKAVLVDDAWAFVGSANLDERSLFLNFELMFAFNAPEDVQRFADWVARQATRGLDYHPHQPSLLREVGEGLLLWLAFQL